MNDAELIALLRERYTVLERAILDYACAMDSVSKVCKQA